METIDNIINAYLVKFRQEILNDFKQVIIELNSQPKTITNEPVWLSPQQARDILGIKSRNSWKKLRSTGEIHFLKIGKGFRYERKSLIDYMTKRSTMKYTINMRRKTNKINS